MIKYITQILCVCLVFLTFGAFAQVENDNVRALFYKKKELNSGIKFGGNKEREELITDESRRYEELTSGAVSYQFSNRFWNFLDYKQDELMMNFEVGPFAGFGNWSDSTFVEENDAEHNLYGLRANLSVDYLQRYYFDTNNYTIVKLSGWGRLDWFKQNSDGTNIDSLGILTNLDESSNDSKFRYGFEARAGWGFGRLNAMNNFMLAQHIAEKYYAGRVFSEEEIRQIADEIFKIKQERNIVNGHNVETEAQALADYLKEKLLLNTPDDLMSDWEFGEFNPRLHGQRIEIGPFFNYFNKEPDFIYGGYFTYENNRYTNLNWNRNFSFGLQYNRYKKQDWASAELNIGWTYFPNLKQQFDFGVKYVPGVELNDFRDIREFSHGIVPYLGYFTQISSKARVDLSFAYRITGDDKMMLPGPEFSLSFYSSRY